MTRRRLLHLAATAAVLAPRSAGAQAYPARPVRVIVPFAPAGPTDVFARLMAQKLSEQLGTQFYVENIAGAGGNIGAGRAAQAPADGYTILVNGGNHVVNPALYQHVSYDPIKDFDPVTIAVSAPAVLTVHPSLPARTVQDLVALIRANPGKYSFASPGTGTPPHLVGELFRLSLGLDLVHV
ncbi:MAG TPA: tripartite tricarboxylate transporter substrate-binding protein, partial [Gemmatimonadales bacterium]|nr:tripartite tricarboxylate transporter substrate-binding protein [Gemmatimonadales bacterium]